MSEFRAILQELRLIRAACDRMAVSVAKAFADEEAPSGVLPHLIAARPVAPVIEAMEAAQQLRERAAGE